MEIDRMIKDQIVKYYVPIAMQKRHVTIKGDHFFDVGLRNTVAFISTSTFTKRTKKLTILDKSGRVYAKIRIIIAFYMFATICSTTSFAYCVRLPRGK
jgi:hypothetical protein